MKEFEDYRYRLGAKENNSVLLRFAGTSLVLAVLALGACGRKPVALAVGAKSTVEQSILAEIVAHHVQHKTGIPVQRKLNLGDTAAAFNAMMGGEVDLYVEYSGAAATSILNLPVSGPPEVLRERVRAEYRSRLNVEWLDPLGFDAAYVIAIPGNLAREEGYEKISDIERNRERSWRLAVTYEFFERPEYLKAFNRAYSIPYSGALQSMDQNRLPHALARGAADMVAAPKTVGGFQGYGVKFLADDKGVLLPMEAAISVRRSALERFPGLAAALKDLSGRIRPEVIRKLNYRAEIDHIPSEVLARQFLGSTSLGAMD
jgi:glycine betaine/choline ABC-type transport system substrate-binding protein